MPKGAAYKVAPAKAAPVKAASANSAGWTVVTRSKPKTAGAEVQGIAGQGHAPPKMAGHGFAAYGVIRQGGTGQVARRAAQWPYAGDLCGDAQGQGPP